MSSAGLSRFRSIKLGATFKRVLEAASLTIVAQICSQALRLGGNLIMTRLLVPEVFGLMSMVLMIQMALNLLSDFGLRLAVIQSKRGDDPVLLNTVWTLQVLRGLLGWIICSAIGYALSVAGTAGVLTADTAWGHPDLPLVLAVTSISFLIGGFQSTNYMTASRHLAIRRIIGIEMITQVSNLLMMIVLAYFFRSVWAIVAAGLMATILGTTLSHTILPGIRNHFSLDRQVVAEIYKFGLWIVVSSTAFVLAANADRALLGALVSATILGLYSIAQNLSSAIDTLLSRLFESVVLPVLSEASRESHDKLRDRLAKVRLPFDILYLGGAGLLFALAPSIIAVLYDSRYHDAGPMLQILSFSLIFGRYGVFNVTYVAMGHPHFQALTNGLRFGVIAAVLPTLFYFYGLTGALFAIALHQIVLLPVYYWINARLDLNDWRQELLALPIWPIGYGTGLALLSITRLIAGTA